jgi:hypothetical protein
MNGVVKSKYIVQIKKSYLFCLHNVFSQRRSVLMRKPDIMEGFFC